MHELILDKRVLARVPRVKVHILDAANVVRRVDEDADVERLALHSRNEMSVRARRINAVPAAQQFAATSRKQSQRTQTARASGLGAAAYTSVTAALAPSSITVHG